MKETIKMTKGQLRVSVASEPKVVLAAQRLRYRVFAEELGAHVDGAIFGLDRDRFDPHCDHLVVQDEGTGEVVGTYRLLPGWRARRIGGFYSAEEFELGAVGTLADSVEVGRACVHPAYRTGATLGLLWSALAAYLRVEGFAYAFGCASVAARDHRGEVARLCHDLFRQHPSPGEWRVTPRRPLDLAVGDGAPGAPLDPPPLLRGYLSMGAVVCGPPAWDPEFGTADLFVLLPVARLSERYARRLLRAA